ncbi:TPA: class I SAM-dependent methyltransferase [Pseudomonas aeruginosa]|jgi:cyclopropane-fatty-acyl-phospholipid synthase|uniref:Class I SAM-dependent methyltransferase n=1 Tax=Pseudomonas aeruginosa TaxID=287 RepID=A0A7M2ZPU5_PSEAI|nr:MULTISPECIES: cyclopropane-fatty-acyl-phospholipid synthase family protein [Pseudomonas]ALZ19633.2 SAM-dependent methyltransferase [Pseudomonas aeruginosa]AYW72507.1 class I SAM-dependent methyltransferase [Pseudomonas aeruginosa]EIU7191046.1 class I SAM-dependent methyltransferase [Pseudomonas aeruginosa]EKU0635699.1 class I SAM-dependent methyltransferase [Pseudomonas aeruginosa]EKV3062649.1 class I SAM-dependent methyltransferase [Pseudomonas aeruginosa]
MSHLTTRDRTVSPDGYAAALRILRRLLAGIERPPALRLGDMLLHELESHPEYTLIIRDPGLLRRLVLRPDPLLLAEAYFRGTIDIEGDLYTALGLKAHFERFSLSWRDKLALLRDALLLRVSDQDVLKPSRSLASRVARRFSHRHSRQTDQAAISFHYDVSNAFYGLWLDAERVYSCGYFKATDDTLDQAQRNKLEHICRKLRLQRGERLLDIGCGWGALVCWAAREHGVRAHGITLSQQQLEYARERIRSEGLQDLVTVELRDYRDLEGTAVFDKVSSIGMFEHVGLANLAAYYAVVQRVLRPGGLFLNHGITHDEEGWNRTVATEFINRYVFPDGELDCVSNIQLGMERSGFEIHDVEGLRPHYALTLRHWVQRLEARREEALREVDEVTFRIWRLYMAACALEFEAGGTGIYQIVASKRDGGSWPVPLTRSDLYGEHQP